MSNYTSKDIEILIALGLRIKEIRLNKNMSQEELSGRTELHRTYIGSVERGERNISIINLTKIAIALSVNVSTIVED